MPPLLRRCHGTGFLHFITTSCHPCKAWGTSDRRDLFPRILEETRHRYGFVVVGCVVMPEHVRLLISEPEKGTSSSVVQVLKQRFARQLLRRLRQRRPAAQSAL